MGENKIDITSTAIEKGIDLVKGFVEKLVGSTLEETGLLLGDNVRIYRLKNQIKMLTKAQEICKENNISMKQISLKTLVPLLEYSSLEDNETLQEKWSNMLVNFIDANKTYESIIFPFILSQLSTKEIYELDNLFIRKVNRAHVISIKEIQIYNLIRLGLIEVLDVNSNETMHKLIELNLNHYDYLQHQNNKFKIYMITELGLEFVKCCSSVDSKG